MTTKAIPVKLLLGILICSLPMTTEAGSMTSFGTRNRPVLLTDFGPHLFSNESYSEFWTIDSWLPDKSYIGIDIAITNIGVGDHKGGFKARFVDPGGGKSECKAEYDDDEWSYAKQGFSMKFGKNSIGGDLQKISVKVRCKKLEMDLVFTNQAPPVCPGSGILKFGQGDGVYSMVFPSPRAHVTGAVRRGGKTIEVDGVSFGEHSYSDMAPYNQARRWFRFKHITADISVIMTEVESTREYGSAHNGWVLVSDNNGKIVATTRARFDFEGFIKDKHSDEGYTIPRRVRIVAVDGDTSVIGTLTMTSLRKIEDPTASLGFLKRSIIRRFTKPRDYYINCKMQMKIKKGDQEKTIDATGFYRYLHVNP